MPYIFSAGTFKTHRRDPPFRGGERALATYLRLTAGGFSLRKTRRIDCIINSEAYAAALLPGIKKGAPGTPTAFHSVFGWVLMGAANARAQGEPQSVEAHHLTTNSTLTDVVVRFRQLGEVPAASRLSEQERMLETRKGVSPYAYRSSLSRNSPTLGASPMLV